MGPEAHGIDADCNSDMKAGARNRVEKLKTPKTGHNFAVARHCIIRLDLIPSHR